MKGIHFVTDADGTAVAVQIDLKQWGELWEDFYDAIVCQERENEPTVPFEDVVHELRREGNVGD
ncbi:MAG TPA: hypothetical protein VNM92_07180 [Thermoanaerobaculia bacterium]|nr:hypothetical protein [Thermoanaerobaculia bacterium]